MKRIIWLILGLGLALPALAIDCTRDDLDLKTAALCTYQRGEATPGAALGGPSGDPGLEHCEAIERNTKSLGDNLWRHYLDIVGGPDGPPADPWDWPPPQWRLGSWRIVNSASDPFAEEWHLGIADADGVRRGGAKAWLLKCAPQIWGGATYVPKWWAPRVLATEKHVAAWVLHPKKLTPADIARMVDGGISWQSRTLASVRLGLGAPAYPPREEPPTSWRSFVGEVVWHLKKPTFANIWTAMGLKAAADAEREVGWPNRPGWPGDGPAVTLWRAWSENPPPDEPPDDCPCPGCVPCEREHCDDVEPLDVLLYDFEDVKSPRPGDVIVFRPEIAPHAPTKVLEIEHTVTLDELPGRSLALIYAVTPDGDGGDGLYVQARGRRLVVRAGVGDCWRDCGSPKPKKTARLSEKIEVGRPYTMTLRRVQNEGLTVVLRTEHVELARVKMGPEAAPGPFLMARCDAGHDGSQVHKGELPTVGSISGWAMARF